MLPSVFISHGSPMLALEPGESGPALQTLANTLPRPRAVVVMSAHWESRGIQVMSSPSPATWHDFGGFPPALYALQYPAPGEPTLAAVIQTLLQADGLESALDARRPLDHGAWVPLSLMYPNADIPTIEISVPSQDGPTLALRIGAALAALRKDGVLLIGSGSITHNLGELDWHDTGGPAAVWAVAFRDWITDRLAAGDRDALLNYRQQAPYAMRNHPSDEHLLPLYFAMGAGERFELVHTGFTLGSLGMDIYRFN